MRSILAACGALAFIALSVSPVLAQSAPGQTVNVTPNQQTTQATAVSSPSGQNISQQNNFFDPGSNAFGPGIQCSGPYIASSLYRNDSSNPGSTSSGFANVGGTIGIVVPLNGSNKKCQEFVNEIVFQRQIDTCLSMIKQGFSFDPNGQYASLAKRCNGIHYTGSPIGSAHPISPPQPPTVITVPAHPSLSNAPFRTGGARHAEPTGAVQPATISASEPAPAVAVSPKPVHLSSYCQTINAQRRHELIARVKADKERRSALDILHAACISDSEIMAAL
jgi:hypothetical protein